MEDFTLTMNCGYPSQDVIVGGESCSIMDEIFCPDLPSFVKEEIVLEDSGPDLSSDDGDIPSPISADEDLINVNIFFSGFISQFKILMKGLLFLRHM